MLGLTVPGIVVNVACNRQPAQSEAKDAKRYMLRGKILGVNQAQKTVTIAHEDIQDFMPAMTMDFKMKDERDLARVQRGDRIEATLYVAGTDFLIETPFITRPEPGKEDLQEPPKPLPGPKPGDAVPDVAFVNQDNKRMSLGGLKGRTVVVTFFFTRCPMPNFCPLMNENLKKVAKDLEGDAARAGKVTLLSISFDPEFDTPRVLAENRARYRDPKQQHKVAWDFVTGKPAEVKKAADFFGVHYEGKAADTVHNLRTAVIGPDGKVVQVFTGNEWKPEEVLAAIRRLQ